MRVTNSLLAVVGIAISVDALAVVKRVTTTVVKRQDGPVDPSTTSKCTFFDTAYSESDNCAYFESNWGISHADFVAWNPSVLDDCSGIKVFNSYCVEAAAPPTTTTSAGPSKPSPTQVGLIDSCTTFYKAVSGDTCDKVVSRYGTFNFQQFYAWNPAVGSDCSGLQLGVYYCVGIPGTPSTTTTGTSVTGTPKPSPTQEGLINTCTTFYKAVSGDTCDKVVARYGTFNFAQFYAWNPAVGSDCSGLQLNVYYCVGIPGTPTAPSTTRSATTTAGNGIKTPLPTQPGMVSNCDAFYFVKSGDTCQAIADQNRISLSQFITWNNVGGASCSGLQASVNACVSIIGHTPSSTTTTARITTTAGNGIATPSPFLPGMVSNCDAFELVKSGDTCAVIAARKGISTAQIISWNPNVKSDCSGLWLSYYVCVSIVGHTPSPTTTAVVTTTRGNGVATPTPFQPGMVTNCNKFHFAASSSTTCQSIATFEKISLANFYKWNPQVGSSCTNLWANTYSCVGVIS